MENSKLLLPKPPVRTFSKLSDAVKYGGYSSNSLIAYLNEELDFITPGANYDYIERVPWNKLVPEVLEMIKKYGKNAAFELHQKHKEAIVVRASGFIN